jgi:myo-inositol-1(or 4)-monophosphatase
MDEAIITAWNSARTGGVALLAGYEAGLQNQADRPPDDPDDYRLEAEKSIRKLIGEAFPEHLILSSPRGGGDAPLGEGTPVWFVNALDGAFNYRRNSPLFSISIGLASHDGKGGLTPLIGVVLAPALMEMFWATLGGGAHYCKQIPGIGLNEGPISVSDTGKASRAVVRTEMLPGGNLQKADHELQCRLQSEVLAFSREASVSLSIAYVAAGRAECFYSPDLDPAIAVPTALLVTEAGGQVSDFTGRPCGFNGTLEMVATNRILHQRFLEMLGPEPRSRSKAMAC